MALKKKKITYPFLWDSNVFCSRGSTWKRLSNVKPYAEVTGDFVLVTYYNCIFCVPHPQHPGPQLLHTVVEFNSALEQIWVYRRAVFLVGEEWRQINHGTTETPEGYFLEK